MLKLLPILCCFVQKLYRGFQGLNITSYSLTWNPYLIIGDCSDDTGQLCNSTGALVDLSGLICHQMNMTLTSFKDPNDDWGLFPKVRGNIGKIVEI